MPPYNRKAGYLILGLFLGTQASKHSDHISRVVAPLRTQICMCWLWLSFLLTMFIVMLLAHPNLFRIWLIWMTSLPFTRVSHSC